MPTKPRQPRQKQQTATKALQPARDIVRAERVQMAVQLRKQGASWQEIATACGIRGGKGAAYHLVNAALKGALREDRVAAAELEAQRMDDLLTVYYPRAMSGDGWSFDRVLRLMERRAQLLGLDARGDAQTAQVLIVAIGHDLLEAV